MLDGGKDGGFAPSHVGGLAEADQVGVEESVERHAPAGEDRDRNDRFEQGEAGDSRESAARVGTGATGASRARSTHHPNRLASHQTPAPTRQ